MALKIFMNGRIVPQAEANVSVYDHGLLYGDGVFEGIRQYSGKVFQKRAHLVRLYESAHSLRLQIPMTMEEMDKALEDTLAANNLRDSYIRLIVTRGIGALGISPRNCETPSVIIICDKIQLYPKEMYETGMAIITASTIRSHPNSLSPKVKSLNYLNNIMAKWEAIDAGVPEAMMLNHMGYVCECTGDNIFIVKNGKLLTPAEDCGILVGVTRQAVIDLARQAGITVSETHLTRHDFYVADECFVTGTGAEICPVTAIDKRVIGSGKVGAVTRQLTEAFHRLVNNG